MIQHFCDISGVIPQKVILKLIQFTAFRYLIALTTIGRLYTVHPNRGMYALMARATCHIQVKLVHCLQSYWPPALLHLQQGYGRNINCTWPEIFTVENQGKFKYEHGFHSRNLQRSVDNDWRFFLQHGWSFDVYAIKYSWANDWAKRHLRPDNAKSR